MKLFPQGEIMYVEYSGGRRGSEVRLDAADREKLVAFLEQHQSGWRYDLISYAPGRLFYAENMRINCMEGIIVVNFRDTDEQWRQWSKTLEIPCPVPAVKESVP
ncbi:MAG: hypothetical protein LBO00_01180 [Zoogloeaceae bacterium]|nr:hypothetical protein [Zoogloeaceae bacterium]